MRKSGLFYPLLLLVCWSVVIGGGTYALMETTLHQYLSTRYARTEGRIIRSEVGHSMVFRRGVDFDYNYAVNGIDYTGHRFRYDDHNASLEWDVTVEEHPRWSSQTVYYDPLNPSDSLLQPGVDGGDLLLLLFALPMCVMTLMLWQTVGSRLRDQYFDSQRGGVRVSNWTGRLRVKVGETAALTTGVYWAGGAAFFSAFPVVITGGFAPPVAMMRVVWILVLLFWTGGFVWRTLRNLSGVNDLRIDKKSGTLILPRVANLGAMSRVPASEIAGVVLLKRVTTNPSGIHSTFLPALVRKDQALPLIAWGWSEKKARLFTDWLSHELGIPFVGLKMSL